MSDQTSAKISDSAASATKDLADQAGSLINQASEHAKSIGQQATALAQDAGANLTESARGVVSDASDKLLGVINDQKGAGADRGHSIAEAVRRAAKELDGEIPQAATYVRSAADQIDKVADAIRRRDIGELVGNVQDMARAQPTAFLAATVLAGFAVVRLLKTSKPASVSSVPSAATNTAQRTPSTPQGVRGQQASSGQHHSAAQHSTSSGPHRSPTMSAKPTSDFS